MAIIAVRDLCFTYPGGIAALSGLDLVIDAGETLAILGPNGGGKTTLFLHLNGSLRPDRGMIEVEDQPARYDRRTLLRWRATVGLVLQDPDDQLFAGTVFQDVSFGPLNLGLGEAEVRARVTRVLADLRLTALADRPIHMLSLGQKRRVAIAGALAMAPRLLILDEPTAGLDPRGAAHMLAALRRLAAAGTTLVYATHDVDLACAWSSRVALLSDGRVLATGPADEVLADEALLRRAHLRRPLALDVGRTARDLGLVDDAVPLPRTAEEVRDLLRLIANRRREDAPPRAPG